MGKPKTEIKEKDYYKDIHFLYEILHSLQNVEEVKIFMKDMLTSSELRMLKRRWHIANLLMEGHDMRSIAQKSKCSTQTITNVKRILEEGQGGLRLALKRTNTTIQKERKEYVKSKRVKTGGSKFVKNWLG